MNYTKQKSIHIVRLPRTASIELIPCFPQGETLPAMYERLRKSGQPLPQLLVNANFFHLGSGFSVSGMKYSDGTLIDRSLGGFYVYRDGRGSLHISTEQGHTIHQFTTARWALESAPLLLPSYQNSPKMEAAIASQSHPRTAIGLTDKEIILLVTDGRPFGLTCVELAGIMRSLGCHTALNLDGGRSSQLVIRGKQVNRQWTRRKIFAALAVYSEEARG